MGFISVFSDFFLLLSFFYFERQFFSTVSADCKSAN